MSIPFHFDPYFEGETDAAGNGPKRRGNPETSGPALTPLGKGGYLDPADVRLANNRSMAELMPSGPERLRGTVIPRATLGGVPSGVQPHAVKKMRVTIDPHVPGQSSELCLGDVSKEAIMAAIPIAARLTPEPYDYKTLRLRGAAVLHAVAAASRARKPKEVEGTDMTIFEQAEKVAGHVQPPQHVVQEQVHPAQPHSRATVSPLSSFQSMPRQQPVQPTVLPPAPATIPAPELQVTFEVRGFGTTEAYFHDVIVGTGFVVLVWDTRYRGMRWFPPSNVGEGVPQMAMIVAGRPEVYKVIPTGVAFEHNEEEFCILMVEETGTLQET